jgi:DNA-binding response OmpR family regulator
MGRVLVVDDDVDVRAALTMLLENDGHSIVELDDGMTVLDIIAEHGVDVILLDLSLPKVDGFEVLSMLMLDPRSAGIPVIVVSARGLPDDRAQAMALGATDYVYKPWGDGEVEFRVRMALGRSERKWAELNKRQADEPGAAAAPPAQIQPIPETERPTDPQRQPSAPARLSRSARPTPRPAAAPQPANPAAPVPMPAAHDPAPRPLYRRPRVRRIVRRIRRRVA